MHVLRSIGQERSLLVSCEVRFFNCASSITDGRGEYNAGQVTIPPSYLDIGMGGYFEGCGGCKVGHTVEGGHAAIS